MMSWTARKVGTDSKIKAVFGKIKRLEEQLRKLEGAKRQKPLHPKSLQRKQKRPRKKAHGRR